MPLFSFDNDKPIVNNDSIEDTHKPHEQCHSGRKQQYQNRCEVIESNALNAFFKSPSFFVIIGPQTASSKKIFIRRVHEFLNNDCDP